MIGADNAFVTLNEASAVVGKSRRTLLHRIKTKGGIEFRKVKSRGARGFTIMVNLDDVKKLWFGAEGVPKN